MAISWDAVAQADFIKAYEETRQSLARLLQLALATPQANVQIRVDTVAIAETYVAFSKVSV